MSAPPATVLGTDDHAPRRIGLSRLWRIAADHGGIPPAVLGPAPPCGGERSTPGAAGDDDQVDPVPARRIGVLVRPVLAVEVRSFVRDGAGATIVRRATAVRDHTGRAVGAVRDGADDRCEVCAASWPPVAEVQRWLGAAEPADLPADRRPTAALVAALTTASDARPGRDPVLDGLAGADRYTEIAVARDGRITPAAMVVYDGDAGRIVAVPSRAGDGRWWTSTAPGTPARIADGLRRLVAAPPCVSTLSPAGP